LKFMMMMMMMMKKKKNSQWKHLKSCERKGWGLLPHGIIEEV
jgi:hypothetical protein